MGTDHGGRAERRPGVAVVEETEHCSGGVDDDHRWAALGFDGGHDGCGFDAQVGQVRKQGRVVSSASDEGKLQRRKRRHREPLAGSQAFEPLADLVGNVPKVERLHVAQC